MNNKLYFFIGFFFTCLTLQSQTRYQPAEVISTGIFYDLVVPLSGIRQFDGTETSATITLSNWKQVYFELSNASSGTSGFIALSDISKKAKKHIRNEVIPIALLGFKYNYLGQDLGKLTGTDGKIDLTGLKVPEFIAFSSVSYKTETFHGREVVFSLPDELVFSNFNNKIISLLINFDDNKGWREMKFNEKIRVSYQSTGIKTIKLKAEFDGSQPLYSSFNFDVKGTDAPTPSVIWPVQGDIPYSGITTTGDAYVFLAAGHRTVEKPIILSEGIDFNDNLSWDVLYDLYNQQNLLENLRSEGFDMIIFNYSDPINYIQCNGLLMVKLIQMINDTTNYSYPVSVVGPSMGGLVCRYALAYMEANGLNHNANLYFSFDVPQQGANIPLGLQYLLYFFKDIDASILEMLSALDMPAAKQMLVYHYTPTPTTPAGHDPLFDSFYSELNTLGYPQNLRSVGISNGRADGVGQPYAAGAQVISYNYSTFLTSIKGNVWSVKNNASGQITEGKIVIPLYMNKQQNVTVFSPKPYDNAPGGDRSTFAEIDSIQAPYGDIIALQESHCFVPTVSALDYAEQNLFYNIAADPLLMEKTPFDTVYWEVDNYNHVYISENLAAFAMNEIFAVQPEVQVLPLKAGWNAISSTLDPSVKEPSFITNQLGSNFVILQHLDEIYWPSGGVNTLSEWDYKKGYVLKVLADTVLSVTGKAPVDKSIQINTGWNLISVLTRTPQPIIDLFGSNHDYIQVIQEAAGLLVYWPEAGITTLLTLEPGKSYYLRANQGFTLSY